MAERPLPPQEKLAAFRKGAWHDGIQFYVGSERYSRLKNFPSAQAYDFMSLKRAALIVYPKPVDGLSSVELDTVRRSIIDPK